MATVLDIWRRKVMNKHIIIITDIRVLFVSVLRIKNNFKNSISMSKSFNKGNHIFFNKVSRAIPGNVNVKLKSWHTEHMTVKRLNK